ncbi:TetR/AcrR family transcriptional regulator [Polyangium aurulentum]|uniref:TetR/AcrR family transcriptional regulator n=1 Tax=Polyangium aurulentum TaxID=2567896 RepID=UPI0010AE0EA3|nr:TetR/AcrR family transcriptional regulator [Polyangium aurulentum]UQA60584.1 TetR/AcrR family transcriptional regulator [Polyangium aurulentum]
MSETPSRRLSKAERREQLLETALAIVREEGTDALTLGRVAERAGVTKPIAYEHFKTRSGLLIAMCEHIDVRQRALMFAALERAPARLADIARIASSAYMHCYTSVGPEWYAITAALKGDEEMEAYRQRVLDEYAAIYRDAFAAYAKLPKRELHLRCVGIIGAAESIASEMLRGRTSEAAAAEALASLIVAWLSPAA